MLLDTIKKQSLEARKAKDTVKANLLGLVLADIQNEAKKDNDRPSTDQDAERAIRSQQKRNQQALDLASTPQLVTEKQVLDGLFPPVDASAVDLHQVLRDAAAANPDKFEAAKADPKLRGWFRGQLMKATGGKAPTASVDAALNDIFA